MGATPESGSRRVAASPGVPVHGAYRMHACSLLTRWRRWWVGYVRRRGRRWPWAGRRQAGVPAGRHFADVLVAGGGAAVQVPPVARPVSAVGFRVHAGRLRRRLRPAGHAQTARGSPVLVVAGAAVVVPQAPLRAVAWRPSKSVASGPCRVVVAGRAEPHRRCKLARHVQLRTIKHPAPM